MKDNIEKQKVRDIVKNEPLWGKSADALAKIFFPNAIHPEIGIAKHARYILWSLMEYQKTIIKLPRFHGKSTYVTFLYVMWCILTQRKKFILIVSSTGNQAVKFLARIRHYLTSRKVRLYYGDLQASSAIVDTDNESFEFVEVKGKKRSQIWNYKELYIEPWGIRIMATSLKSANRGLLNIDDRPDLEIWDDIEDKNNTNTFELRQKLSESLFEELVPAGTLDCQFIAIGTICHYGSYLLRINKSENWHNVPLDRATMPIDQVKKLNDLLPEHFPEEYRFDPQKEYFTEDVTGIDGVRYKRGDECPEVAIWQGMYSYQHFCKKLEEYDIMGLKPSFFQEHYNTPKNKAVQIFSDFQFLDKVKFKRMYGERFLNRQACIYFQTAKE
jgi:hypothetical protein